MACTLTSGNSRPANPTATNDSGPDSIRAAVIGAGSIDLPSSYRTRTVPAPLYEWYSALYMASALTGPSLKVPFDTARAR